MQAKRLYSHKSSYILECNNIYINVGFKYIFYCFTLFDFYVLCFWLPDKQKLGFILLSWNVFKTENLISCFEFTKHFVACLYIVCIGLDKILL